MTDEQRAKQRFVDRRLRPLLQAATANEVADARYAARGAAEEVVILYRGGAKRAVNVAGDSLKALALDVLDAV